jgi:hypothetical protein
MTNETQKKLTYFLLGTVLVMFCWLAIITGFVVGVCEDVLAMNVTEPEQLITMAPTETIEETEAVTDPTEVETTPVETIIPEVEETIPEATEATEPEVVINQRDLELLACVIYTEAGGDNVCDECRMRVADVVLNRVDDPRFFNTIEGVLTQQGQYSNWSTTGVVWPERAKYEYNTVQRAYRIAEAVLSGTHSDLYGKGYIWQARFKQGNDIVYCCGQYFGR